MVRLSTVPHRDIQEQHTGSQVSETLHDMENMGLKAPLPSRCGTATKNKPNIIIFLHPFGAIERAITLRGMPPTLEQSLAEAILERPFQPQSFLVNSFTSIDAKFHALDGFGGIDA